jgi:hypothetical protein
LSAVWKSLTIEINASMTCADFESAPVIYVSDKSIRFHISRREWLSIHDHAFKHNILYRMRLIEPMEFHTQGISHRPNVLKRNPINVAPLAVPSPRRFVDPKRNQPRRFFDAQVFEPHIADAGRITMIYSERPLAAFVVDDVAVGKEHVVHVLPKFGSDTQCVCYLVPEDTIPGNDAPRLPLAFVRFHHNQIIEGP